MYILRKCFSEEFLEEKEFISKRKTKKALKRGARMLEEASTPGEIQQAQNIIAEANRKATRGNGATAIIENRGGAGTAYQTGIQSVEHAKLDTTGSSFKPGVESVDSLKGVTTAEKTTKLEPIRQTAEGKAIDQRVNTAYSNKARDEHQAQMRATAAERKAKRQAEAAKRQAEREAKRRAKAAKRAARKQAQAEKLAQERTTPAVTETVVPRNSATVPNNPTSITPKSTPVVSADSGVTPKPKAKNLGKTGKIGLGVAAGLTTAGLGYAAYKHHKNKKQVA